jgi:ectoine hydroxylase-related dioxygenase (phytanoyl-CoA dioxygenase family)
MRSGRLIEMRLTEQQIRQFFETGFVVLPRLFERHEVRRIGRAFERLQQIAAGLRETTDIEGSRFVVEGARTQRIVWCNAVAPELERWCSDPRLLEPVFQLLEVPGEPALGHVVQIICQAHLKLPGDGVGFPWHQDAQHRRYGSAEWVDVNRRGSYVQTALAVDEMTVDNGPLLFVPDSCRDGALPLEEVERRAQAGPRFVLTAEPGSVVFFGPYTIHGSEPNRSEQPRRAWINGYACPGANRRPYPGCGLGLRRPRPRQD